MAVQVSSVHFTSLKTGLTCAIQARRLIASSPRPIRYQAAVLLPAQCLLLSALRTQLRHNASSSLGGWRTPAPVRAAPPSWGRHPQTFTSAEVEPWALPMGGGRSPDAERLPFSRSRCEKLSRLTDSLESCK